MRLIAYRLHHCYFLLLFMGQFSYSQKQDTTPIIITASPLAFIDLISGTTSLRMGAETSLYNNITFGTDFEYYVNWPDAIGINVYQKNVKGYQFRPAFKYYLDNEKPLNGRYIGIEYQYKKISYTVTDTLAFPDYEYTKSYDLHRQVNSISLKYGHITNFSSRWFTEWYAGLGVRFVHSRGYGLTEEEFDNISTQLDPDAATLKYYKRKRGDYTFLNVLLGFKIVYRIE